LLIAAPIRWGCAWLPVLALAGAGRGQCAPHWSGYPGPFLDDTVYAVTVWDPDGAGPGQAVVVAGGNMHQAGATPLDHVGQWDGQSWRPLGSGVSGTVRAACVFDPDGPGPEPGEPVLGGFFTQSGGHLVNRIARFNGSDWQSLGSGMGGPLTQVLTVSQAGAWLVAGGNFSTAGGIPVNGLARWDGATWSAFPAGGAGQPSTLALHAGVLHAGGDFLVPGSSTELTGVLRWTGIAWETVGQNYPRDDVNAFATYRGELIAAGFFCCQPTFPGDYIARFDGVAWHPLGSGFNGPVRALCTFDPDGPGPDPELLIAGGSFTVAGGQPANCVAAWDGAAWTALGQGTGNTVRSLAVWRHQLVVAGDFVSAGGIVSPGMAFWGCSEPAPCYPNCDGSTEPLVLNVNDFVCFTQRFAAADPWANCDQSTEPQPLNVGDFVCFMQRFAAGCR
jgi:hypothetical protein